MQKHAFARRTPGRMPGRMAYQGLEAMDGRQGRRCVFGPNLSLVPMPLKRQKKTGRMTFQRLEAKDGRQERSPIYGQNLSQYLITQHQATSKAEHLTSRSIRPQRRRHIQTPLRGRRVILPRRYRELATWRRCGYVIGSNQRRIRHRATMAKIGLAAAGGTRRQCGGQSRQHENFRQ